AGFLIPSPRPAGRSAVFTHDPADAIRFSPRRAGCAGRPRSRTTNPTTSAGLCIRSRAAAGRSGAPVGGRCIVVQKFTLRTLTVAVGAIAVSMALLVNPTWRVVAAVVNGVLIAVLVMACLAAGLRQPARSFCLGFAIACSGALLL